MRRSISRLEADVIHHLRQQTADVDAVGGAETMLARAARRSTNASFTSRWQSSNVPSMRSDDHVVAPAGELLLLPRAHQTLRIQNDDPHPGPQVKRRRHRAAGVARRSPPEWSSAARTRVCRRCERLGQKARAEILEGRGRPVKQLEHEQRIRASRRRRSSAPENRAPPRAISPSIGLQPVAREESVERAARDLGQARQRRRTPPASTARQPRRARTVRRPAPVPAGWPRST